MKKYHDKVKVAIDKALRELDERVPETLAESIKTFLLLPSEDILTLNDD